MFKHNGVYIQFSENTGKFYAGDLESTSLAGIKKKLDKQNQFQKFDALITERWNANTKRVEIVGIAKGRGKYGRSAMPKWKDSLGNEHITVYEATPENEDAIKSVFELQKMNAEEIATVKARHQAAQDAAWQQIKKIDPPASA